MRGRVVSSVGRRCRVAVAAFAAFAAATGVAGAAAPTYNLNGTWSMTLHCNVTIPGTLIVTHWKSSTGTLKQKVIIGRRAEKGTATESGNTVTVNSSNLRAVIGHIGTVSKVGSKLVMVFHFSDAECPSSGTATFVNDHPAKKHHKHHRHHKHHHKHHKKH